MDNELICPHCGEQLMKVELRFSDLKHMHYKVWICGCSNIPDREKLSEEFTKMEKVQHTESPYTVIEELKDG